MKLEKLVGDVKRREDEMRKAKTEAEVKAKGASVLPFNMFSSTSLCFLCIFGCFLTIR